MSQPTARFKRHSHLTLDSTSRLSVRLQSKDLAASSIEQRNELLALHGRTPEELVTHPGDRRAMLNTLSNEYWIMSPSLRERLKAALDQVAPTLAPVMPPTDYETLAYLDEHPVLKARLDCPHTFIPGREYKVFYQFYNVDEPFLQNVVEFNKGQKSWLISQHHCTRTFRDRRVVVRTGPGSFVEFRPPTQMPGKPNSSIFPDDSIWKYFERPHIPTVREVYPERYDRAIKILDTHALLSGITYYPGQKDYIARLACRDYGIPSAQTGTGKTLIALSLSVVQSSKRTLILAPKHTVKGCHSVAQWEEEVHRFLPLAPVYRIFSHEDLRKVRQSDGSLPFGIYLTYPEAYLTNAADECPPPGPVTSTPPEREGIGEEHFGIRCVARPSLLTLTAHLFDMTILDEAHVMKNANAARTRQFLRIQTPYRYAMTATPVSNTLPDLCTLMGWTAVPDWHKDDRCNPAWPYSLSGCSAFAKVYLAQQTDHTRSDSHYNKHKVRRKFITRSPIVSEPLGFTRLVKPVIAHIDKQTCNPLVVPCIEHDVRVPFGERQENLYRFLLNPAHFPMSRRGKALIQQAYLREACVDPSGLAQRMKRSFSFTYYPQSCITPKMLRILEIAASCLRKKEQVVIIASRINQLSELEFLLHDAGIECSRMDSTVEDPAAQAGKFKSGETRVLLMGIRMAQAHSFSNCPNLILASLEWTYSSKVQAMGRVWRMDSPRPVNIWCVLNRNSIEEVMYDRIASKAEASVLCLQGLRSPGSRIQSSPEALTIEHVLTYRRTHSGSGAPVPEYKCQTQWLKIQSDLSNF